MDVPEGIERQLARCKSLVNARGWDLVRVFKDNDTSASKDRGSGTAWADMLAAAQAGEFDVIVATKLDRLARRVKDVITLQGLGVGIATLENDIDTTTASGRFQAQLLAALAELEVARKGERHIDAHRHRAAQGIPRTTKRPYGWQADGIRLEPTEAEHLRTALRNIVAGGSIRGEAKRMNEAGARTPVYKSGSGGKLWTSKALTSVLDRPRMAGINTWQGVETENSVIEPVVSRDEWDAYQAIRGDDSRLTRRPGRTPLEHWLSGVASCPCGQVLGASTAQGRKGQRYGYYRCRDSGTAGHVGIAAHTLEKAVSNHVYVELLRRGSERVEAPELAPLRKRVADLQKVEKNLDDLARDPDMDPRRMARLMAENARELAEAREALAEANRRVHGEDWAALAEAYTTDDPVAGIFGAAEAFRARWADTPVERKRQITRDLLSVRVLADGEPVTVVRLLGEGPVTVPARGEGRIVVVPLRLSAVKAD